MEQSVEPLYDKIEPLTKDILVLCHKHFTLPKDGPEAAIILITVVEAFSRATESMHMNLVKKYDIEVELRLKHIFENPNNEIH